MLTGNLVLATDLSSRCDRALDRAVVLAKTWRAPLTVLHALEYPSAISNAPSWRQPPDPTQLARQRLRRDLRGAEGVDIDLVVTRGEPVSVILDTLANRECRLVITGMARDETLGRVLLGSTVENLARRCPVPILVVKNRPAGDYRHIVVATDFSDPSLAALEIALTLFPSAQVTVFHAYHVVFEGLIDDKAPAREAARQHAMARCRDFIGRLPPSCSGGRAISPVCEYGEPGALLQELADARHVDLVVLGSEGRSGLAGLLLGSTAQRIMAGLDTDVLVVRANADD